MPRCFRPRLLSVGMLVVVAACHGPSASPTSAVVAPAAPLTPTSLRLVVSPAELPAGGGAVTVFVEALAGTAGVRDRQVGMAASSGALDADSVTTDSTGHGTVVWRTDRAGIIQATLGDLAAAVSVKVGNTTPAPGPAPNPSPNPNPTPPPAPTPAPTPGPPPTPPVPEPPLLPAGDLVLSIDSSPAAPNASTPVTWTASLTSNTGAAVPRIDRYVWDVNGDQLPDHVDERSPVVTYAAGSYTARLFVQTSDGREVTAQRAITIGPGPVVSATLAISPATASVTAPITFTATATTVGDTGAIATYAWDFDSDGTVDQTTANNTVTLSPYTTQGTKTASVKVTSANGQTATATKTVIISDPPLAVTLGVAPAGPQPAGTTLTITATVTSSGAVPSGLSFAWDYENDGVIDEVTPEFASGTGRVGKVYNTAGSKTIRVTVTSPDGRTATNTTTITVS